MLIVLPNELELLRDMRPLDRDVFNYLAERIDYDTGIIGKSRCVSYGGMALDLSESDVARRAKGTLVKVSSRVIRNCVIRLINAGLLSSMSAKGFHHDLVLCRVFWVNFLSADNSVKNPVGITVGRQLAFIAHKFNSNNNGLQHDDESRCDSVGSSVGITSVQHTTPCAREEKQFSMRLDWQPDQQILDKVLSMSGFMSTAIKLEWINEFITYWFSQPEKQLNSQQWTIKLARLLVDYLAHPGLYEKRKGIENANAMGSSGLKNIALPDWARVPKDDMQLVPWMHHFGYGDPPIGLDYRQARAYLQRQIEFRLKEWRRGLS